MPDFKIKTVQHTPVLLVKRFDRSGESRIPFLSAMTLIGAHDGEEHSYLEIANAITERASHPEADLAQLWRRMVFNMAIRNQDDHLRNHGFLWNGNGWGLSPCYDLTPTPDRYIRPQSALRAGGDANLRPIEQSIETAHLYELSKKQAGDILDDIAQSVRLWKIRAQQLGISAREIRAMSGCFALATKPAPPATASHPTR